MLCRRCEFPGRKLLELPRSALPRACVKRKTHMPFVWCVCVHNSHHVPVLGAQCEGKRTAASRGKGRGQGTYVVVEEDSTFVRELRANDLNRLADVLVAAPTRAWSWYRVMQKSRKDLQIMLGTVLGAVSFTILRRLRMSAQGRAYFMFN